MQVGRYEWNCRFGVDHEDLDGVVGACSINAFYLDINLVDQIRNHDRKARRLTPLLIDVVLEVETDVCVCDRLLRQVLELKLDAEHGPDPLVRGL